MSSYVCDDTDLFGCIACLVSVWRENLQKNQRQKDFCAKMNVFIANFMKYCRLKTSSGTPLNVEIFNVSIQALVSELIFIFFYSLSISSPFYRPSLWHICLWTTAMSQQHPNENAWGLARSTNKKLKYWGHTPCRMPPLAMDSPLIMWFLPTFY